MKVKLLQPIGAFPEKHAKDTVHDFEPAQAKALIAHGMAQPTEEPITEEVSPQSTVQSPQSRRRGPVTGLILFALFAFFAAKSSAITAQYAQSFSITNTIQSGVNIIGYPTNSGLIGMGTTNSNGSTNLSGNNTGGPVYVPNQDRCTLFFTAQGSNTNTVGKVSIVFVRSIAGPQGAPPVVVATTGYTYTTTNGSAITTNTINAETDWETTPLIVWTNVVTANSSNVVTAITNLDFYSVGYVGTLGVWSVTNNDPGSVTQVFTNVQLLMNGKIIPIRYP